MVATKEIVGIFDMDTSTVGKTTRDFLANAQKRRQVVNVSYELPKSFVLCAPEVRGKRRGNGPPTLYISQLSAATLRKRSQAIEDWDGAKG